MLPLPVCVSGSNPGKVVAPLASLSPKVKPVALSVVWIVRRRRTMGAGAAPHEQTAFRQRPEGRGERGIEVELMPARYSRTMASALARFENGVRPA